VSRWRGSTWAAIVWTAIIWLIFAWLVGMAIKYGGAIFSDAAVFGGAGLLFLWLVGLGIVAVERLLTNRWQARVMADVGTADGGQAPDTAPTSGSRIAPNWIVRHAAAAIAGVITTFAASIVLRVVLTGDQAAILAFVAGSVVAGAVLEAREWGQWAKAVLLLLVAFLLLGLSAELIRLLAEPALTVN
jgi:hypothetical protein